MKADKGVDVAMLYNGNSTFFDATNPRAREYVWNKCRKNYYDKGIRVFWLDEAEPEFTGYDFDNYRYFQGPAAQVGNIYPQSYARTFYEGLKAAGEDRVVSLLRCAWAGSQRYGALVWSGDIHSDWEDASQTGLRRTEYGDRGDFLVDHGHRRLFRRQSGRSGLPPAAGALV